MFNLTDPFTRETFYAQPSLYTCNPLHQTFAKHLHFSTHLVTRTLRQVEAKKLRFSLQFAGRTRFTQVLRWRWNFALYHCCARQMLGIQVHQGSHFKVDTLSFGTPSSAATPFYTKKNGMFSQRKTLYIRNLLHQTFDIFSQMPFNFNLFNNDNNDNNSNNSNNNNNNNNNFYTKKIHQKPF